MERHDLRRASRGSSTLAPLVARDGESKWEHLVGALEGRQAHDHRGEGLLAEVLGHFVAARQPEAIAVDARFDRVTQRRTGGSFTAARPGDQRIDRLILDGARGAGARGGGVH